MREVYARGFQASSIEAILKTTHLTKGAFFHHFDSKRHFGYTLVEEVIHGMLWNQWAKPLQRSKDPLQTIAESFKTGTDYLAALPRHYGCPLNNLAQEMSSLDEGFRRRIQKEFEIWKSYYYEAFERAKQLKQIPGKFSSQEGAHHLLALVEGTLSLAKASQDPADLEAGYRSLLHYLTLLRNES